MPPGKGGNGSWYRSELGSERRPSDRQAGTDVVWKGRREQAEVAYRPYEFINWTPLGTHVLVKVTLLDGRLAIFISFSCNFSIFWFFYIQKRSYSIQY